MGCCWSFRSGLSRIRAITSTGCSVGGSLVVEWGFGDGQALDARN